MCARPCCVQAASTKKKASPPGWDAAAERRDAQDELRSAAQARAWAGGDFDADHGFAFDGVGGGRLIHRPAY
jgi:hypothetical protein